MASTCGATIEGLEDADDYLIDIKDVSIGKMIGEGMFASVFAGKYFGDYVAVKKQVREAKSMETYLIREITVLKKAQHPNVLTYVGAHNELNEDGKEHVLYIVTDFCQGGDLLELLIRKNEVLGWKFRVRIAMEAANAISFLHSSQFIHRDVKSSNILLDANWNCKLCDFGLAREVDPNNTSRMTICGTQVCSFALSQPFTSSGTLSSHPFIPPLRDEPLVPFPLITLHSHSLFLRNTWPPNYCLMKKIIPTK